MLEKNATAYSGSRPPSAPTTRPATSSAPTTRSWPSAASTAPIPGPTLAVFERLVGGHRIHYFIAAGSGGGAGVGGSTEWTAIASWVEGHFSSVTVGGTTLYDLTKPLTSSPS